ncbi:MAG: phospholipase D family protein [Pseudomonadota bacterium]
MNAGKYLSALMALFTLAMVTACATLPDNSHRRTSHAVTGTQNTRIGTAIAAQAAANVGKSGFLVLSSGVDAFVARAVLAQTADQSIDAQYYLLHDDMTGALFIDQLIKAADRGVRVRLLVDDMDLGGRDLGATLLDSHPNMEVRLFNPFSRNTGRVTQFVSRLGSVTRRMHNKSFTVDNQATILGGRNIGDEYFEANPDLMFGDLDVLAVGPAAKDVSASFDRYWNDSLAYPATLLAGGTPSAKEVAEKTAAFKEKIAEYENSVYIEALKNSDLANQLRKNLLTFSWGTADVVSDSPEKLSTDRNRTEYHLAPKLEPYFAGITRELIIFSPYFVPGDEGTAFLTTLVKRGMRVRILTNSLASNDVGMVHAGYDRYRRDLLRGGVELYELNKKLTRAQKAEKKEGHGASKASLHAKSFVFDRQRVFIGSLNLDPRSVVENTEIGVVINSAEIAEGMGQWFDAHIDQVAFRLALTKDARGRENILWHGEVDGKPQTFDVDPYTGFWKRFGIALMGLLPIESQL